MTPVSYEGFHLSYVVRALGHPGDESVRWIFVDPTSIWRVLSHVLRNELERMCLGYEEILAFFDNVVTSHLPVVGVDDGKSHLGSRHLQELVVHCESENFIHTSSFLRGNEGFRRMQHLQRPQEPKMAGTTWSCSKRQWLLRRTYQAGGTKTLWPVRPSTTKVG